MVASSTTDSPILTDASEVSRDTPVTGTSGSITDRVLVPFTPSTETVIVTSPSDRPVTFPSTTLAMDGSEDVHATVLHSAPEGETSNVNSFVSPMLMLALLGVTETESTGVSISVTVTLHSSTNFPSAVETLTVVVPGATP